MDIIAQDCRISGFSDGIESYWLHAIHLPTGVTVENKQGPCAGVEGKRRIMEKLQIAVNQHMDDELAKL